MSWTIRRSNQSILKEINPESSLEGLMLKLKLQYTLASWFEESTHWKRPWFWERLRVGGEGGKRGWDGWMASPIQWTGVWTNSGRQWRTWKCGILQSMGLQRVRHNLVTEKQQNSQMILNKWAKATQCRKISLFNSAATTKNLHVRKASRNRPYSLCKNQLKIKFLEDNWRGNLDDLIFHNKFLDTTEAQSMKKIC